MNSIGRRRRGRRLATLAIAASLAVLTVFPIGAGATSPPSGFPDAGALTLSMRSGGDGFSYSPPAADSTGFPAASTQALTASSKCTLSTDGSLVTLNAGSKPVGLVDHSLGVKSGGSSGVPCGRVDSTESLTLTLAGTLSGYEVDHAELDIEAKGSAIAVARLYLDSRPAGTRTLRTGTNSVTDLAALPAGTSSCSGASDSGPDAGAADNCTWAITDALFDEIVLTVTTGEISLEGGGDYPALGHETVFHLTDVDVLDCGETVTDVPAGGTMNELTNVAGDSCLPIVYFLRPVGDAVWLWKDPSVTTSQLIWTTTWDPEAAPTDPGELQIPPTKYQLEEGDTPSPLEWCGVDELGAYVVPGDWCIGAQSAVSVATPAGETGTWIQVTDTAVGKVDPFKLR